MTRPLHTPRPPFQTHQGELVLGGQPLSRLAQRVGQTPFYAYSRQLIRERIQTVRNILPKGVHLHYAIKANPMPALVQYVSDQVDGLDIASAGELDIALNAGTKAQNISFAGPGKRAAELAQALAAGVLLHIESEHEAQTLSCLSQQLGLPARVALRINPDFELKSAGMRMGGGAKPFGIDVEKIPSLLARLPTLGLKFEGFHLFAGSQNLQAGAIIEAQRASYALAVHLAQYAPSPILSLNLGGGFGIPYFPGEHPLALEPIQENLHQLAEAAKTALPGAHLVLELGRYLVGEAGVYVCRIVDRKVSRGEVFYVCDGGLHHHLAASGNFGQLIRKDYPVAIGNRMDAPPTHTAHVVGPLCTPLDILADRADLPDAQPGDFIVVFQSGAYGASASPQAFLHHPLLKEVLV